MDPKNSVEFCEEEVSKKIWPEIAEHLAYLCETYNLCFKFHQQIDGKDIFEFDDSLKAQMIILMRITDFIRGIKLLAIKGYPEQAGSLAASIFELTHTSVHFSYTPQAAKQWLASNSIKDEMPKAIGICNYRKLVEENCNNLNLNSQINGKYEVYKQLCWMKHSLPKMQGVIAKPDGIYFQYGPYSDERSINHIWFAIEHAGELTEFALSKLINFTIFSSLGEKLNFLSEKRAVLHKKAIERFGKNDPFKR